VTIDLTSTDRIMPGERVAAMKASMIERIITGGQTGADQGAWRAAKAYGIPTGGWLPRGFLTEDGPRPEFAELYGAQEHASADYAVRRAANVQDCDAALLFGDRESKGSKGLIKDCRHFAKPWVWVEPGITTPRHVAGFLAENRHIKILLVAGNRESASPEIGVRTEVFMGRVFALLEKEG
jgi:hypothetical protein